MMTTQSSPIVTEMKVIPVAGQDSMLLNIGGAHNAPVHPQHCGADRQRREHRRRGSASAER